MTSKVANPGNGMNGTLAMNVNAISKWPDCFLMWFVFLGLLALPFASRSLLDLSTAIKRFIFMISPNATHANVDADSERLDLFAMCFLLWDPLALVLDSRPLFGLSVTAKHFVFAISSNDVNDSHVNVARAGFECR